MFPRQLVSNALRCVGFVCEFTIGGPLAGSIQAFRHEERKAQHTSPPTGDNTEQESSPKPSTTFSPSN
jgi:hypothetical protein